MISDAELLKLVMERYPEQPTPFIIEQFTVLKAGLIQANNKLAAMDMEEPVCEQVIIEEPMPEAAEAAPSAAPKKKFTKISMKQNWTTWRRCCSVLPLRPGISESDGEAPSVPRDFRG